MKRNVRLDLRELVWPHRLDIIARLDALRMMDVAGPRAMRSTALESFSRIRGLDVDIEALAHLYTRSRAGLSLPRGTALEVADHAGPHTCELVGDPGTPGLVAPSRYALVRGDDAVAVMLHLGTTRAWFRVTARKGPDVDATTVMQRDGAHVDAQTLAPWRVWPSPARLLPSTPAQEPTLDDLLRIKDAHLALYEERLDQLFIAVGGAELEPVREPFQRDRPAIGALARTERALDSAREATARSAVQVRRAVRWRTRAVVRWGRSLVGAATPPGDVSAAPGPEDIR